MPLMLAIKVIPNAAKQRFVYDPPIGLKVYVTSPAQDGKANEELIRLLAKTLDIAKKNVTIAGGYTSRNKRIHIQADISLQQVLDACGISPDIIQQTDLFHTSRD